MCIFGRYKSEESSLTSSIKLKEQQMRDARNAIEHARYMTEENRRRGINEVFHADQFDFFGTEKEIARMKVVFWKLLVLTHADFTDLLTELRSQIRMSFDLLQIQRWHKFSRSTGPKKHKGEA